MLANECWSFLDSDILNSIFKLVAYGTKSACKKNEKYQKKLKEFCKRRVSELPTKVLPLHNSSEHQSETHDLMIIKWDHSENNDPNYRT